LSGSRTTGRIRRSRTQSEFFFSTIWPKIAISRIERRKRYVSQSRTVAGPSRPDKLPRRKREENSLGAVRVTRAERVDLPAYFPYSLTRDHARLAIDRRIDTSTMQSFGQ
jgi:hypothetical protein